MRKLFVLTTWLIWGGTGLILIIYAPYSWQCTAGAVDAAIFNPQSSAILLEHAGGSDIQIWNGNSEQPVSTFGVGHIAAVMPIARSEERRVGKECRSRWSPYH